MMTPLNLVQFVSHQIKKILIRIKNITSQIEFNHRQRTIKSAYFPFGIHARYFFDGDISCNENRFLENSRNILDRTNHAREPDFSIALCFIPKLSANDFTLS